MKILVTGAAGFIGSRVMDWLSQRGDEVMGIDCINSYYDIRLKYGRLLQSGFSQAAYGLYPYKNGGTEIFPSGKVWYSSRYPNCRFVRMDISDKMSLDKLFINEQFDKVVNLAAQAGVRYSIENPYAYLQSNLSGFLNILEACRNNKVSHLVYASSSSVYGLNVKVPYSEDDKVDSPVSLYAATKKSNELMAHAYCKLYGISMTGLRFFTVYGPWGRPDMSPMLFANAILHDEPIKVFNNGDMIRDYTYIDDIVEGTIGALDHDPTPNENGLNYRVYNIGCSNPVRLMDFIKEIECALGKDAKMILLPMQPGDVYQTNADTTKLEQEIGYKPCIKLKEGIGRFISWYRSDSNPLNTEV